MVRQFCLEQTAFFCSGDKVFKNHRISCSCFSFSTKADYCFFQCCGIGSLGSVSFRTSQIRICHYLYGSGSGSFHHQAKIVRKTCYDFSLIKLFFVIILKVTKEKSRIWRRIRIRTRIWIWVRNSVVRISGSGSGSGFVPTCHGSTTRDFFLLYRAWQKNWTCYSATV